MDKLKAIIKREYLTRVRSKGFIIGTLVSPLLLTMYMVLPGLMLKLGGQAENRVAVLDLSGDQALYQSIEQLLTTNKTGGDRYELQRETVNAGAEAEARKSLDAQVADGRLTGYFVLPADVLLREKLEYHAKNVGDFAGSTDIRNALNEAIIERRMVTAGLDLSRFNQLSRRVQLDVINQRGESEEGQTFLLTFGLIMAIYVSILVYGIMVMRGVIEEKQWRIVEVLLSSVSPFELMLGKLIGVGMVGLTQFSVWALTGMLLSALSTLPMLAFASLTLPKISLTLMIFFVVYFLLGYFLYATLYAMVGAIVSNEEDGQQLQMPVTMTIIIPVMASLLVLRDPNGWPATLMSLFPFFSPVLMFMRISFQTPPAWQIALSIVLLLGTILGLIWLAAKIYRVGVLMYGKRPSLPEVARWLKYS